MRNLFQRLKSTNRCVCMVVKSATNVAKELSLFFLTGRLFSVAKSFAAKNNVRTMSAVNPWNVVFVLGPPGCGKGTQCSKLTENYGFIHLSAGDLLREERCREGSQFGKLIENHMRNGTIVPVEITCKLIENAMTAVGHPPGFLIDGFPRNRDNLDGWTKEMGDKTKLLFVLFLECPEDVCVARCLSRGQGRIDDNEESLKKRYQNYLRDTMPIIKHFEAQDSVKTIETSRSPNEVFDDIRPLFEIIPK